MKKGPLLFWIWPILKAKGSFFSEIATCLSYLQNQYSKSLYGTWNLEFLPITVNNSSKFKLQDSDLEYTFFRAEFDKKVRRIDDKKNCFWHFLTFIVSINLDISTDEKEEHEANIMDQLNNQETSDLRVKCNGETFYVHR